MTPREKSRLKVLLIFMGILGSMLAWLAFGERGFIHLYHMEMERQEYVGKIKELAKENKALLEEIHLLRTDPRYVEAVARRELGLVKENEVIFRFKRGVQQNPSKTGTVNPKVGRRSWQLEREVEHNAGIK